VRVWLSVAALVAGVVLLVAALVRAGDDEGLPRVESLQVGGQIAAGRHLFGDLVPATVDVLVPNETVDPKTVSLHAGFDPYAVADSIQRDQRNDGPTTLVRYSFDLWCVKRACIPGADGADFLLPPATVAYRLRGGPRRTTTIGWPSVGTTSRITEQDAGLLHWRPGLRPLPALTYSMPPRLLAFGLLALAVLAALLGTKLVAPQVRAMLAALPAPDPGRRLTVLERALAAVRNAAAGEDTEERRRALDMLARELRRGRRGAAGDARELAWSAAQPRRDAMEDLADRVEGAGA
jgi:hypothetical protein